MTNEKPNYRIGRQESASRSAEILASAGLRSIQETLQDKTFWRECDCNKQCDCDNACGCEDYGKCNYCFCDDHCECDEQCSCDNQCSFTTEW